MESSAYLRGKYLEVGPGDRAQYQRIGVGITNSRPTDRPVNYYRAGRYRWRNAYRISLHLRGRLIYVDRHKADLVSGTVRVGFSRSESNEKSNSEAITTCSQ